MFVVSSSVGSVKLLKIDGKEPCLAAFKEVVSWGDIHFFRYAKVLQHVTCSSIVGASLQNQEC
jgi:hypothetical protein